MTMTVLLAACGSDKKNKNNIKDGSTTEAVNTKKPTETTEKNVETTKLEESVAEPVTEETTIGYCSAPSQKALLVTIFYFTKTP